jgi:Protein of unknown function (DUF2892)
VNPSINRLALSHQSARVDSERWEVLMFEKLLPVNEHPLERAIRLIAGLGLLSLAFVGPHTAWGYLGVVPLATGIIGSCPAYTLFGLSTCPLALNRKTT